MLSLLDMAILAVVKWNPFCGFDLHFFMVSGVLVLPLCLVAILWTLWSGVSPLPFKDLVRQQESICWLAPSPGGAGLGPLTPGGVKMNVP